MAIADLWDYLSPVTADYTATELTIRPRNVIVDDSQLDQVIHWGKGGNHEVITLAQTPIIYVTLEIGRITEADAGTVFDLYINPAKANQWARSFYWLHYGESAQHTYTAKFAGKLPRRIGGRGNRRYGFSDIQLLVMGRKP